MSIIITLPAPNNIPLEWLQSERTAKDIVLAIHEVYFPGIHDIWFSANDMNIAKYLITNYSDVTHQIFMRGQSGITHDTVELIAPGAVKVYE